MKQDSGVDMLFSVAEKGKANLEQITQDLRVRTISLSEAISGIYERRKKKYFTQKSRPMGEK